MLPAQDGSLRIEVALRVPPDSFLLGQVGQLEARAAAGDEQLEGVVRRLVIELSRAAQPVAKVVQLLRLRRIQEAVRAEAAAENVVSPASRRATIFRAAVVVLDRPKPERDGP